MNTHWKQSNKKIDRQEPSRVLLVCIYDTVAFQVTNELVYEKFSKYGPIFKVLIFEKGQVTKLFVQFNDVASAEHARAALDGTKLLGAICKMNIYFSNFSNVDLKNQTSQGADFTFHQQMKAQYVRQYNNLAKSFQGQVIDFVNEDYLMQSAFSQFVPRSKTDNPKRLNEQIYRVSMPMMDEQQQIEYIINTGIDNLFESGSTNSRSQKQINNIQKIQMLKPGLKVKQGSAGKSPVISFNLTKNISIRCTYNLFSNFGNISFICKKNNKIYVKFRTIQFAAIAHTYLSSYTLSGVQLKFQNPNVQEAYPKQAQYCQCIFYDQSFDRFTPHRSLTVNSPSQTLHVSSLKKDTCKQHVLYRIFGQYGKVQAVKILCYSNQKNMALVKFQNIQGSFQAIAQLHNQIFSGRKMQISFTKSRV